MHGEIILTGVHQLDGVLRNLTENRNDTQKLVEKKINGQCVLRNLSKKLTEKKMGTWKLTEKKIEVVAWKQLREDSLPTDEGGAVHDEVGHLLTEAILYDESVTSDAGDDFSTGAGVKERRGKKNKISKFQASRDDGVVDDPDYSVTPVTMIHDKVAAIPDQEGHNGKGDVVATDGQTMVEIEFHRVIKCGRELGHDALLHKGVKCGWRTHTVPSSCLSSSTLLISSGRAL
ncbi:hypothetical protein ZIOFF_068627 [Zingiber officinale]|uniref:Uncharacterized protein n=1 Tax=Zingiber officinale TaxID=94328 RepID=A0A8J5CHK5_ZINOF|nr:hypothetical protein ZIOFF_068627 [Zingiber officinale]